MRVLGTLTAAVVLGMGAGTAAVAAPLPEADLAYHGSASLSGGRMDVRFTPRNHGPSAVPDATVRLVWSVPLVDVASLPAGCAREDESAVVCRTGALDADGVGEQIELAVRLKGAPSEAALRFATVWCGGAVDTNRANDRQSLLVLDTGDAYYF